MRGLAGGRKLSNIFLRRREFGRFGGWRFLSPTIPNNPSHKKAKYANMALDEAREVG
jgi:hypothetical protein